MPLQGSHFSIVRSRGSEGGIEAPRRTWPLLRSRRNWLRIPPRFLPSSLAISVALHPSFQSRTRVRLFSSVQVISDPHHHFDEDLIERLEGADFPTGDDHAGLVPTRICVADQLDGPDRDEVAASIFLDYLEESANAVNRRDHSRLSIVSPMES